MKSYTTERVLHYFYELCKIPRGSGNMKGVADYCATFAQNHSLKYHRDVADNVIIYKAASKGYENSPPIILQGHLDMVCQCAEGLDVDFYTAEIKPVVDGDLLHAEGTTLGADNGIAVAITLSILESEILSHPPIEAVFTTDEEIGMIGASNLDFSLLKGKRMINLDSEEEDTLTVSCAGGSDFVASFPYKKVPLFGTALELTLKGLKGGHSGVEIDKNRVNSNVLLGRILNHLEKECEFSLISFSGGDKANAIPNFTRAVICTNEPQRFATAFNRYSALIKEEIKFSEEGFVYELTQLETKEYMVIDPNATRDILYVLSTCINGVTEMSAEIKGLVETSLNLGILADDGENILMQYALRGNKQSALTALEERLARYFSIFNCQTKAFGHYPPWEYNPNSALRDIYSRAYSKLHGTTPKTAALHAGLECGVFAKGIKDFDCIAVGPDIKDVHTVNENISISSLHRFYNIIINVLENCF